MDDIPNINPIKPLWPRRPDEQNQQPKRRQQDEESEKKDEQAEERPRSDHDGQIDEYV